MGERLTIGKVAAAAGLTPDTIRYYERLELLPKAARTAGGYRVYPRVVIQRLAVIRSAQRFGFSLHEISGFLRVRDAGGRPCQTVRTAAQRRLDAVEGQIQDLVARREAMRLTLRQWDATLRRTPEETQARLLETL